MIVLTVNATVN